MDGSSKKDDNLIKSIKWMDHPRMMKNFIVHKVDSTSMKDENFIVHEVDGTSMKDENFSP